MKYTFLHRALFLLFIVFTIVGSCVYANASIETKGSYAIREIVFSGITWKVRSGTGNPGGNNWSDSPESVWVDEDGILHLRIRKENGIWYCSEIYSKVNLGYGEYRFYVASNVENLDKNVVAGFFTYLNDKNEIDIEFSKWGFATTTKMGNYATQPAKISGNSTNFELGLNGDYSTHRFIWKAEGIDFKSWHGHGDAANVNTFINQWVYKGSSIPVPGDEELIINMWLYQGLAPENGQDAEILIKSVKINKPPVINDLTVTIPEDAPVSTVIDSLSTPGYDPTELKFSIIDGNELGLFSVTDYGKIILDSELDFEISDFHRLNVVAAVGDMQDTATVEIYVENVVETEILTDNIIKEFWIYPNPVSEELNIDFNLNADIEIQIFGMDGKSFELNKLIRRNDCLKIDIRHLNPGIYILVINNDFKKYSFRFQKV